MSKRKQEGPQGAKRSTWKMKKMAAIQNQGSKERKRPPSPPPPPPSRSPSLTRMPRKAPVISVTRDEIESFWRRKRMEEEDHLLAALKAAARIRARDLKEEDYKLFEASLEGILTSGCDSKNCAGNQEAPKKGKELGAVIRDWWTKSKYAYLNQPAVQSMEAEAARHRATTFTPSSYFWATGAVPAPRPPPALGVF